MGKHSKKKDKKHKKHKAHKKKKRQELNGELVETVKAEPNSDNEIASLPDNQHTPKKEGAETVKSKSSSKKAKSSSKRSKSSRKRTKSEQEVHETSKKLRLDEDDVDNESTSSMVEETVSPKRMKRLSAESAEQNTPALSRRKPVKKATKGGRTRLYESSNIDDDTTEVGMAHKPYVLEDGSIPKSRSWGEKKREGMISGRFSVAEDELLRKAIVHYCNQNQLEVDEVRQHLSHADRYKNQQIKHKSAILGMWKIIAEAFPARTVEAVFRRGERLLHAGNFQGQWTNDEISQLVNLVDLHGRSWVKIGNLLGRLPTSVRDKYSQHLQNKKFGKSDVWSKEDDNKLLALVKRYHRDDVERERNGLPRHGVLWSKVSEKLGRPYHACLRRYYSTLHSEALGFGATSWGNREDDALLQRIFECGADEESEIPWNNLGLLCTARVARSRWDSLKKRVPRFNTKSFDQIMQALDNQTRAKFEEEQSKEKTLTLDESKEPEEAVSDSPADIQAETPKSSKKVKKAKKKKSKKHATSD